MKVVPGFYNSTIYLNHTGKTFAQLAVECHPPQEYAIIKTWHLDMGVPEEDRMPIKEQTLEISSSHIDGLLTGFSLTLKTEGFPWAKPNYGTKSAIMLLRRVHFLLSKDAEALERCTIDARTAEALHSAYADIKRKALALQKAFSSAKYPSDQVQVVWGAIQRIEEILDDILEDLALSPGLQKLTLNLPGRSWREVWGASRSK
jgi:hypothetical protein